MRRWQMADDRRTTTAEHVVTKIVFVPQENRVHAAERCLSSIHLDGYNSCAYDAGGNVMRKSQFNVVRILEDIRVGVIDGAVGTPLKSRMARGLCATHADLIFHRYHPILDNSFEAIERNGSFSPSIALSPLLLEAISAHGFGPSCETAEPCYSARGACKQTIDTPPCTGSCYS